MKNSHRFTQIFTDKHINRKICFILLNILIIFTTKICFAEISGRILCKKYDSPIPFAKIEFLPYSKVTLSNENGYFVLESKETKGKLKISSIGYKTRIIKITPEISSELLIKLEIEPIEISGISVKGERTNSLTYLSNNVEIIKVGELNSYDILEALETGTGVVIQENSTGEKIVSINGCDPKQVAVMIDGIRVNTGEGRFNIGQLPIEMIDRIEIVKNNASAIAGDTAIGGIVNLVIKSPQKMESQNSLSLGFGSWDKYKGNYQRKLRIKYTDILVNANIEKAKNDFVYYNEYEQRNKNRINNSIFNRSLIIKTHTKFNSKISNKFSVFLQNADKGIPRQTTDYMWYENATAFGELYNFKNETRFDFKNSNLVWKNFYQIQESRYKNLEGDIFHKYNSKNQTVLFESKIEWEFLKKLFDNRFKIGYRIESYKFDDLLNPNNSISKKCRKFIHLANSSKVTTKSRWFEISIIPNLRLDNIIDDKTISLIKLRTRFSTKLGLEITPKFVSNLSFGVNFGNSYRMPEFTSLFWKGDSRVKGNPDLQPEKSKGFNGEIKWNTDFMEFTLSGFRNTIEGLIYWYRSAMGIWKPDNLADAQISGISGKINLPICDWLSLSSTATKFYPINKTKNSDHYNNYLLYRPLYKVHNCLNIKISKFELSFNTNHIGEQYDNFSNTVKLKGYKAFDLSCNFSKRINNYFILDLAFWLKNLLDEEYELYRHIPAQGRNYEAKLQIKYNSRGRRE
ncbi:MAG: TonB-dependent receptor [Candidatus Cloacimonetes bacterium]|nr:TonB-dependent receptor [Candidatus Cloacimonadota bacterium]